MGLNIQTARSLHDDITMPALTRWTLIRFWFPFNQQGHLDILLLARHADRYCRRNLSMIGLLFLLQEPVTGMSLATGSPPQTVGQSIYLAAYVPFILMATVSGLVWQDRRPPRS
jgi:hypothetical protein